jgi:hypothetical protein
MAQRRPGRRGLFSATGSALPLLRSGGAYALLLYCPAATCGAAAPRRRRDGAVARRQRVLVERDGCRGTAVLRRDGGGTAANRQRGAALVPEAHRQAARAACSLGTGSIVSKRLRFGSEWFAGDIASVVRQRRRGMLGRCICAIYFAWSGLPECGLEVDRRTLGGAQWRGLKRTRKLL